MTFTKRHAKRIAAKLGASILHGRKHDRAVIRNDAGKVVTQFGIRRGSRETGHDFVPGELQIPRIDAMSLARCSLTKEGYFELLREKGIV